MQWCTVFEAEQVDVFRPSQPFPEPNSNSIRQLCVLKFTIGGQEELRLVSSVPRCLEEKKETDRQRGMQGAETASCSSALFSATVYTVAQSFGPILGASCC